MRKTVVINAVGLTPSLIGAGTPRISAFAGRHRLTTIDPVMPAVTCAVQATYLTGAWPSQHGVVGNGWYFRDECEIKFWRQSDRLVQRPRIWDVARITDGKFTCANLFWWHAMYSSADVTVTPRPMYPADGRKLPDIWTHPADLRRRLQDELGQFPLFKFWGPATHIESTQWIANAAQRVEVWNDPTLSLVYLPHLDYCLQKYGPNHPAVARDLLELDEVVGALIDFYESRNATIVILSEYGITPVSRPVHLNRVLREMGLLSLRDEQGRELLDAGASQAFAVADHQVAHIYVKDPSQLQRIATKLNATPGVARVLGEGDKQRMQLDHDRSGDLVVLAEPDAWFTYYYWMDDAKMPDFARTVDIHRKPGYDPVELFLDPSLTAPKLKIATTLLKRKLGFRSLLDVIPTDASLVRGSHGLAPASPEVGALFITNRPQALSSDGLLPTQVLSTLLAHVFS